MSEKIVINGEYDEKIFDKICENIVNNKVTIMPCDTIYGFLASQNAASQVRMIKNRDEKPFLYLISQINQLEFFDIDYNAYSEILSRNWPGNITFIMSNRDKTQTFGVRMPDYEIIKKIIDKVGQPLLSTSVNVSGQPALNDEKSICDFFGEKADLIVIDKKYQPRSASTIVSLVGDEVRVIRQGERIFNEK